MRINDLMRFGFSSRIVECWRNDGLDFLLPLQVEAVKSHGILDNKDLLICGPTSSGKTFCGELAAMKAYQNNLKAIFLVPLKALADEKYAEFRKRYRKIGLRIIIVDSDYPENKRLFGNGEFEIAIIVYEMFNALTVTSLRGLESVGTIVFDEFQLITTSDRGVAYEAAITKVRNLPRMIQIIGLIGGLDKCDLFGKWLDIAILKSTNRPVELYRGVLYDGRFSFKRFNDCLEGIEYFTGKDSSTEVVYDESYVSADMLQGVKHLIDKGEQALIFISTRLACQRIAGILAEMISSPPADITLTRLDDLPDTLQKATLVECLKHGIGYHNADLSLSYRKLLEEGFVSGEIRVVVCTTTLALGVNLPSKNVFIEPAKYYNGFNGEPVLKPLLMDDYNQIAGRAGRYGKSDDYGRAIIIASDENDRERIREHYINGSAGPEVQLFDTEKLAGLALRWISCGLIKDYNDARDLLKNSLRGYYEGFTNDAPTRVIDYLNLHGFITLKGCRLACTDMGQVAAGHNIELDTAARINDGYAKYKLADNFLSWIFFLTDFPECRGELVRYNSAYYFDYYDRGFIEGLINRFNETSSGPLADLIDNSAATATPSRIKTLKLLADLIQPMATIELETNYDRGWGRLNRIGMFFSNLLGAVADIGKSGELDKDQRTKLLNYAECLYHAVPQSGLPLARLKVQLLERDYILRLNRADIYAATDVVNSGYDIISNLIPESVAGRLFDKCQNIVSVEAKSKKTSINPDKPSLKAKKKGARYEVVINDATINLQPRLYKYLNKLWNADGPDGWLDKNFLDTGNNQVKYIYKLRKALEPANGVCLECDGAGRYRLVLEFGKRPAQGVEVTG
ncbi:MAG: DEAD/DEAH box helicase [candidate division Zixibacteria bacterium]|nr:DEAD/DEAH box helicase [candidate division Zixibacteria bacterium]